MTRTRKIVFLSSLTALAIVLSIVESFIPDAIPGVKLGLANIVTLIVLFYLGYKEALIVHYLRILIVGITYTGILSQGFLMSLSGGTLAILSMILLKKFKLSLVSISSISACLHVLGQLLVLMILMNTNTIIYYLPIMLVLSIPSGAITGTLSGILLKRIEVDVKIVKLIDSLALLVIFSIITISTIIVYKTKYNHNEYISITSKNTEIISIDLNNPNRFNVLNSDMFIEHNIDGDKHTFKFNVYNYDTKEKNIYVVEVIDGKVKVVESDCKTKECIKEGSISNIYKSIICVPNKIIISIKSDDNSFDAIS